MATTPLGLAAVRLVPFDYATIQQAIDAAIDGDTVLVAPGIYHENIDFRGKAIVVTSSDGPQATTVDGGRLASVVTFASGEGRGSILERFTLTNGSAVSGGGVACNRESSPTIRDNVLIGNEAVQRGGAIACSASSAPLICGNRFEIDRVTGGGMGGAISCEDTSNAVIHGNDFTGCQAIDGFGGAIAVEGSQVEITDNVFTDNDSAWDGGAIYHGGVVEGARNQYVSNHADGNGGAVSGYGTIHESHSVFAQNWTRGSGGAVVCMMGEFADCEFTANWASNTGGAVQALYGVTSVVGSRFTANDAYQGGALALLGSDVTSERNTFAENRAFEGGAVHSSMSRFTSASDLFLANEASTYGGALALDWGTAAAIRNTTCTRNRAFGAGGAAFCRENERLDVGSSILWQDSAPDGAEIGLVDPAVVAIHHSDVEGGWPGSGNIDAEPRFVDPARGDLRMQGDSPCVDAGDPGDEDCGRDLGQRPRRVDGHLAGKMIVDMGAHEFSHVDLSVEGSATPGGVLRITTSGTAGLDVALLAGTADAELCLVPFGSLLFDPGRPWHLFAWGCIPSVREVAVPEDLPVPLTVILQELAVTPSHLRGNTSGAVSLHFE